jgi:uncharacterized PurR-regulated membrane protein YhhQ (DUF165 family)
MEGIPRYKVIGGLWALAYLLSIVFANWLVQLFGIIKLGPFQVPAGVVLIGFTFTLRDIVQRYFGKTWVWLYMLAATVITMGLNERIAIASGAAFLISETIDFLIYTWKAGDWSWNKRIMVSNAVSTPVDSFLFVWFVFGLFPWIMFSQALFKFVFSLILIPFFKKR